LAPWGDKTAKQKGDFVMSKKLILVLSVLVALAIPATALAALPYRLPWRYCNYKTVTQGWNGTYSHSGQMQYAYDFNHYEGEQVRTSNSGTVAYVKSDVPVNSCCSDSSCANNANYVVVNHNDGTATLYLHLRTVSVANGASVDRGKPVGTAGHTGWTGCVTHLHFQRQGQGGWFTQSQAVYFEEYPGQQLQQGSSYRSGNRYSGDPTGCPRSINGEGLCVPPTDALSGSKAVSLASEAAVGTASNWVAYENQTRQLRFRYPSNWKLSSWDYDREPLPPGIQESFHISFLDSAGSDMMGLSVYENHWPSPEAFLKAMQMAAKSPEEARFPFATVLRTMKINGREALAFEWNNIVTGSIQSVVVAGDRWLYVFHTWPARDGKEQMTERVNTLETLLGTLEIQPTGQ
jgi:hypothetical protein